MKVTLVGAGGHCREVISSLRAGGLTPARILDDSQTAWGTEIMGVPVEGPTSLLRPGEPAHISIGSNRVREIIALAHPEASWTTIIHPSASVCPSAKLGAGCLVGPQATVFAETVIGCHVIINSHSLVSHESQIGDFCQTAPGAILGGCVVLGARAYAGIGCSIHQGSVMEEDAVLGGGAFLKGRIPKGETWVGVPARPLRKT